MVVQFTLKCPLLASASSAAKAIPRENQQFKPLPGNLLRCRMIILLYGHIMAVSV
jgi:hypothetical protein